MVAAPILFVLLWEDRNLAERVPMPRVAVTIPYFDFFPEIKAEFAARYPGTKFRTDRMRFNEDQLIDYLKGYDAAVIGIDFFTERVCAALPELKVVSLCSAGSITSTRRSSTNTASGCGGRPASTRFRSRSSRSATWFCAPARAYFRRDAAARRVEGTGRLWRRSARRTVGIHGCGHIGKEVVKLLQPYGVKILACDRVDISAFCKHERRERRGGDCGRAPTC